MCEIAGWARGCGSSCWAGWSPPSPARPRYTSHARCASILVACVHVHLHCVSCRPRATSILLPLHLRTAPTVAAAAAATAARAAASDGRRRTLTLTLTLPLTLTLTSDGRRRALLAVHCLRRVHDLQAHLARRLHPRGHRAVPRHRKPLPPHPSHPCSVPERPLEPGVGSWAPGGGNTRLCPRGARGGVA